MILGKILWLLFLLGNNFEIIDLGVMVPPEKIIETAQRENVDIHWAFSGHLLLLHWMKWFI